MKYYGMVIDDICDNAPLNSKAGGLVASLLLLFQQPDILIHHRSTNPANSCQFRNIQRPLLIRRIMPQKSTRQILNRNLRPPNSLSLGPSVRHTGPHTHSYHSQLQLTEHPRHLQKRLAHRVRLPAAAVRGD